MPRPFKLSTGNMNDVIRRYERYPEKVLANVRREMAASMERCYATAASLCPYDKEERDSFHMIDVLRQKPYPSGLGYEVGFKASDFREAGQDFYPPYTEYGTSKMAAQPCIGPAREEERPRLRRALREAVRE